MPSDGQSWHDRLGHWLRHALSSEEHFPEPEDVLLALPPASVFLSERELSAYKEAYLRRLRVRVNRLYFAGLDERRRALQENGQALDLTGIYQPLNTTIQVPLPPADAPGTSAGVRVAADASPAGQVRPPAPVVAPPAKRALTGLEAVGRERQTVLFGVRGAGKTMLLRYVALAMAGGPAEVDCALLPRMQPAWQHGMLFPVWIDLREFRAACSPCTTTELLLYVAHELGLQPQQFRDQLVARGGVLFMLDNLEAAPEPAARFVHSLVAAAARAPSQPANHFLITSQPYVDVDALPLGALSGFARVTLALWTQEQMDSFARCWYAELQRKEWIGAEAARDLPGQLCAALRRPEVRALARRPGLMSLTALLHTLHGRLPVSPAAYYQQLVEYALNAWGEGRQEAEHDLRQMFDVGRLRAAIAQMVYQDYVHLEDRVDLVPLMERELKAALFNVSQDGRLEAVNEFIYRIQTRPSLLDEPAAGVYTLVDLSLQAYIVAGHLARQPGLGRQVVHLVEEDFYHWRQVVLLVVDLLVHPAREPAAALELIDALAAPGPLSDDAADGENLLRRVWLAGESLVTWLQSAPPEPAAPTVARIKGQLTRIVELGRLVSRERAECGRVLSRLPGGDERPGVTTPAPMWCPVPDGPFWQGEEDAARLVELPAFWIGRYPVTNRQYLAFVQATGHPLPVHWQGDRPPPGTGNHPVVMVTWEDARAYAAWWNEGGRGAELFLWTPSGVSHAKAQIQRQWQVRLPSSDEWEKAARGGLLIPAVDGTGLVENPLPLRRYPWGDSWTLSTAARPGDETRCNVSESDIGTTSPVGMYPTGASPLGMLDAAGNVWEWCLDWADKERHFKIRRGGAFRYTHEHARCAATDQAHPELAWPYVGFRLVLGPPAKS